MHDRQLVFSERVLSPNLDNWLSPQVTWVSDSLLWQLAAAAALGKQACLSTSQMPRTQGGFNTLRPEEQLEK